MKSGQFRRRTWAGAALVGVSLSGCAQFWDDLTAVGPSGSYGENFAYRMNLLTNRFDPLPVLRDSKDGDMRARALRMLREPITEGGNEQDQEFVLNLLTTAARSEKPMLCRLAAVETLGKFHDPRAAEALAQAYRAPLNIADSAAVVRMEIVRAIAKVGHPAAVETLTVAIQSDSSTDVRIAAARSLGRFDNYQATQALVGVLKQEKDVALREQARNSLAEITGQKLPAKAEAWENFLHPTTENRRQAKADQPKVQPVEYLDEE